METFDWKSNCMFCGGPCQKNIRYPDRSNCHEVTTLHFKEQMLLSCQKRHDQISKEVALRVCSCNDLVAVEALYHTPCRIKFMNPEKIFYSEEKNTKKLTGRPAENKKVLHFVQLCEYTEQEAECYIKELHQKMIDIANSPTVYIIK